MPERKVVLIDELPQRNGWCSDYLERTLDCKKCSSMATVVDGQSRPVFDVCLWDEGWRMIRQGKPTRKCNLLKILKKPKARKENKISNNGAPDSYFVQERLPLDID